MIRLVITILFFFRGVAFAELVPSLESVALQRDGKSVIIPSGSALVPYGQRLIESCSFDASETHGSVGEWKQIVDSPSYLLIRYQQETSFTFLGKERRIREILIPLPSETWPSYLIFPALA